MTELYACIVKDVLGHEVSLEKYKNNVLLIVNTATHCGFTPQYAGLQKLYDTFKAQGFEILDFPCNQFGQQAPETNEAIDTLCTLKYATTFPRFAKIDVNGSHESPLYTWLKAKQNGIINAQIKWNFTKFLVDRKGTVVARYGPHITAERIEKDVHALLIK
ncbi:putative glutathione peroxidase [Pillotina sp. SPG140]